MKPELEFHQPLGPWTEVSPGINEQELSEGAVLQRYDAGAISASGAITHDYWEEVYLVSGSLTDISLEETFTAGSYACRPPAMVHGPYRSDDGCLMFVMMRFR